MFCYALLFFAMCCYVFALIFWGVVRGGALAPPRVPGGVWVGRLPQQHRKPSFCYFLSILHIFCYLLLLFTIFCYVLLCFAMFCYVFLFSERSFHELARWTTRI